MNVIILGFLKNDKDDDSLKFKFKFEPSQNPAILNAMNWDNLENYSDGQTELSSEQIQRIESATNMSLPTSLSLFLSIRSGPLRD